MCAGLWAQIKTVSCYCCTTAATDPAWTSESCPHAYQTSPARSPQRISNKAAHVRLRIIQKEIWKQAVGESKALLCQRQQNGIFINQRRLNSMLSAPFFVLQDWRVFQHDPRTHLLPRKQSLISWWAKKIMKLFSKSLQISNLCTAFNIISIWAKKSKQLQIWIAINKTAFTSPTGSLEIPYDTEIVQAATEILLPTEGNKSLALSQWSLGENTNKGVLIKLQRIQLRKGISHFQILLGRL